MNPLVLVLPLLAASCFAAPAKLDHSGAIRTGDCDNEGNVVAAAPYAVPLGYNLPSVTGFPAAAYASVETPVHLQAPAPLVVPGPVQAHVHYADKPVVSGYSTQIYKPAIGSASFAAPALAAPVVAVEKTNVEYTAPLEIPVAAAPQITFAAPEPVVQVVAAEKTKVEYAPAPVAVPAPQWTVAAPQQLLQVVPAEKTKIEYAPAPVAVPAPQWTVAAPQQLLQVVPAEKTKIEYAPAPVAVPAPQWTVAAPQQLLQVVPAEKTKIEYAPAPVAVPAPQTVVAAPQWTVAAPQIAVAAPVEAKIHYADTPVVTGYSTEIIKPAIGSAVAGFPAFGFQNLAVPSTAEASFKFSPVIPSGDAPAPEELVQKEKVLAPVRAVSSITPEVTVHHPTKVNVERVPVDVHVPAPYAQPVPVAVPVATAVHAPVAPAFAAHTVVAAPAKVATVPCDQ